VTGSAKRERELARQRHERQQARREAARRRQRVRNQVVASAVAVVLVIGGIAFLSMQLGDGDESDRPQAAPSPSSPTQPSPSAANVCPEPAAAAPKPQTFAKEPAMTIDKVAHVATIRTNCGVVEVQLDGKAAPRTVNSFAFLAGRKYFDGTPCHRLTTQGILVLQCGDPTGSGSGGPGYKLPDENLKKAKYPAGTVAVANSGPNTGGSQFFIVYGDSQLGPQYTPFGKVTKGLDVVKKIAGAGAADPTGDGAPNQKVVIESFSVKPKSS
jgi:peptidyl-prolyl cis-trans isomerase B (cyclophilin B)